LERFKVTGGKKLEGRVDISGAKNAALPILAASLLTGEEVILENVPNILDVHSMCRLLNSIGCRSFTTDHVTHLYASSSTSEIISPLAQSVRYSINLLGPLLSTHGSATISLPGGCKIGTRKIDSHLTGLQALGATVHVDVEHEVIKAEAEKLMGTKITLEFPSVSATEHILSTSCRAEGKTIIQNVAKEPEIVDLANFLNSMGAKIKGAGTDVIKVEGVSGLNGTKYAIIPDRIEAGTYMVAATITKGDITIQTVIPRHLQAVIEKLSDIGSHVEVSENAIQISTKERCKATNVLTGVYPSFPTDMQPIITPLLTMAKGVSTITENLYESRFAHIPEIRKMGAKIDVKERTAILKGTKILKSAKLTAHDIRCGAAVVLAALAAEGTSEINNVHQIDRGYQRIEEKLKRLGAEIERIDT